MLDTGQNSCMADAVEQQSIVDAAWEGTSGVRRAWQSIVPIWGLALLGAILTVVIAQPSDVLGGVSLTMAVCTVVTLAVQLATRRKQGFVSRVTASLVGSGVVLAVATVIFLIAASASGIQLMHR